MTPWGGERHEWLGGISLPGSGKHWRAMVNTLQLETGRRLAQKGHSGCPAHLGASQTSTCPSLMHGDPGIHNCRKLPGDSTTTSFRLGVMLKPNPSPAPFLDEGEQGQGGKVMAQPTQLHGTQPGLTWPLPPAGSLGSVHRSPGATRQEDDSPEPLGQDGHCRISFPCQFQSQWSYCSALQDSSSLSCSCDLVSVDPPI